MTARTFTPDPSTLYFTDNGSILCGHHLGMSAATTGRDISGQPIEPVTASDLAVLRAEFGDRTFCETCEAPGRRGREPR